MSDNRTLRSDEDPEKLKEKIERLNSHLNKYIQEFELNISDYEDFDLDTTEINAVKALRRLLLKNYSVIDTTLGLLMKLNISNEDTKRLKTLGKEIAERWSKYDKSMADFLLLKEQNKEDYDKQSLLSGSGFLERLFDEEENNDPNIKERVKTPDIGLGESASGKSGSSLASQRARELAMKVKMKRLEIDQNRKMHEEQMRIVEQEQRLRAQEQRLRAQERRYKEMASQNELEKLQMEERLWRDEAEVESNHGSMEDMPRRLDFSPTPFRHQNNGGYERNENKEMNRHFNQNDENFAPQRNEVMQGYDTSLQMGMLQTIEQMVIQQSLPMPTVTKFTGCPENYISFKNRFKEQVLDRSLPEHMKMSRLLQFVDGNAKDSISGYDAFGPGALQKALKVLEEKFGQPYMIITGSVNTLISQTKNLNNKEEFRKFSQKARKIFETLNSMNALSNIDNPVTMKRIVSILPIFTQRKWLTQARKIREATGDEPKFYDLVKFIERIESELFDAVYSLESSGKSYAPPSQPMRRQNYPKVTTLATLEPNKAKAWNSKCLYCEKNHKTEDCYRLLEMNLYDRRQFFKDKRVCFNCLSLGHIGPKCQNKSACKKCGGKHMTFLHFEIKKFQPKMNENSTETRSVPARENHSTSATVCNKVGVQTGPEAKGSVYLQIVPVKVIGKNGNSTVTYALLDNGSTSTICTKKLIDKLGIDGSNEELALTTISDDDVKMKATKASLTLASVDGDFEVNVPEVWCIDKLNIKNRSSELNQEVKEWDHLKHLKFPKVGGSDVSILIGADVPKGLMVMEYLEGPENAPIAVRTNFGWSLLGNTGSRRIGNKINYVDLNEQLERFWKIEQSGMIIPESKKGMSVEDKRALDKMESSCKFKNGHYEIGLPWKREIQNLPNNRYTAEQRLESLKRKMLKNEEYASRYTAQIEDYINEGYARLIPDEEIKSDDRPIWYLPHHGVTNPQKPDKLRCVFDAAAKYCGVSLNDELLQGPEMTNSLLGVLLRFRENSVAIKGDIKAMFHQVKVNPKDQNALRFLWWENGNLNSEPKEYQMTVHIFGATSSPTCCNFALRRTAMDNLEFDEETRNTVLKNFYVDDALKSVETPNEAKMLIKNLTELLKRGGFKIHKWVTNNQDVFDVIPKEDQATLVSLDLDEDVPIERALGIQWEVKNDLFTFKVNSKDKPLTKRGILSATSSLFDPMGMVSPFVLAAKQIIQEAWRRNIDWDTELPEDLKAEWYKWVQQLPLLSEVKIPRCFRNAYTPEVDISYQLHVFGDASQKGYGAVAYLRMKPTNQDGEVRCSFVMAKSRLAPVKTMSIPRLELQAAITAVRMMQCLKEELTLKIEEEIFWTDSTTVLKFIRNETKRFSVFVANRIGEIRNATSVKQWRYVNTEDNPSDEASRGQHGSDFIRNERWFNGPAFLSMSEKYWPVEPDDNQDLETYTKEVKSYSTQVGTENMDGLEPVFEKFSSWYKIKKSIAWLTRYVNYVKLKKEKKINSICKGDLTVEEIENAELKIMTIVQKKKFHEEYRALKNGSTVAKKSQLYKLKPILLDDVIRVAGRMELKPQKLESRHQIILPSDHVITKRIIEDIDRKLKHTSGREYVLSKCREHYWPLNGRRIIRKILNKCFTCRKVRAKAMTQMMANLPEARLTTFKPVFTSVGVDYFGPLYVKVKRSHVKRWGCVFTCMTSRAIHIEVAESLDTSSCVNAIRRFISRRGKPERIFSDNGTNFVAANKELKLALEEWNKSVEETMKQEGIKWYFNPPAASHMGGVWERMIRSIRRILTSLVNKRTLTDYELMTVFAEAENLINGRPITSNSDDPNDFTALTPNHLLMMRGQLALPPGMFSKDDPFYREMWKQVQYLVDEFWNRWTKEYLPSLQERKKWQQMSKNIEVNDLVLMVDKNISRANWSLARVTAVIMGRDGLIRSAKIKTADGKEYLRPIVKMCLLESVADREVQEDKEED